MWINTSGFFFGPGFAWSIFFFTFTAYKCHESTTVIRSDCYFGAGSKHFNEILLHKTRSITVLCFLTGLVSFRDNFFLPRLIHNDSAHILLYNSVQHASSEILKEDIKNMS